MKSKSTDIRLTDSALFAKINDMEERIRYAEITKVDVLISDKYIATAETSLGSKKILLGTQHGFMVLQYLVNDMVAPIFSRRDNHV